MSTRLRFSKTNLLHTLSSSVQVWGVGVLPPGHDLGEPFRKAPQSAVVRILQGGRLSQHEHPKMD